MKKGFATVYEQCSREVKEKLKSTKNWEAIQREQCLHCLIKKIKRICVGFNDHKQDVFNLVQVLKTLFCTRNRRRTWSKSTGETSRACGTW